MRLRLQCTGGVLTLLVAACSSVPQAPPSAPAASAQPAPDKEASRKHPAHPNLPAAGSGRGGYYQDDGPGDHPPDDLMDMPDAQPRVEPWLARTSRIYTVFGKTYTPITDNRPFKQRGIGSWYGRKFHGQKTSSGERYDMYKMTAAHPTLPIPSYARVTHLSSGRQVVVRINDRGPFHAGRIIDLSYTAALKLGYLGLGSSELEVERLLPDEIVGMANIKGRRQDAPVSPPAAAETTQTAAVEMPAAPSPTLPLGEPTTSLPIATAVPTTVPTAANGFYLQLGAYAQAANAQALRSRLQQQWSDVLPPIEVVENDALFRLYSGPFATRADAASAAAQAGLPMSLIVQR